MLVKLLCPQCGAAMEIDDQQEQIYCSHCGTKIANIKEKVEITQNVNVSGTVRHVMDRSNEPNLYISYATANPSVVMVVRVVDTGTKNTYLNGQTQTYHLRQGQHEIVLKIGRKNYNRTIIIPEDNAPVRINAAFTGRRAEITIDQPNVTTEIPAVGDRNIPENRQAPKRKQSVLGIIAFILSFLVYTSPIAVGLAIFDLIRSKKDEEHSHGLAIAALIIGSIFSLGLIISLVSPKTAASNTSALQSYQNTTISEANTPVQNKSADEQVREQTTSKPKPTANPTQKPTEPPTIDTNVRTGIRPEFQKMMDEYLQFFREYCDFMKKYMKSPDVSMMTKYYEMMQHYLEATEALDEIDEDDLSKEELKLYSDTMNEINKMLIDLA